MTHRNQSKAVAGIGLMLACAAMACGADTSSPAADAQSNSAAPAVPAAGPAGASAQAAGSGARAPALGAAAAVGVSPAAAAASSQPSASGAAASGAASGASGQATGAATMPCDVAAVLAKNCQSCHAATPIGGAPMPLVTFADMQAPAKSMPSLTVHEISQQRLNDSARPMPPGGAISAQDKAVLNAWLSAGAPAGAAADVDCAAVADLGPVTPALSMEPLVPREGETCYEFKTHGSTSSVDDTPYEVMQGEHYANFYFKAPWPDGTLATRFGAKYDNLQVLHHWLLFSTAEDVQEGYHETSPLPTLLGVNATLISGWAVGGSNLELPEDVGAELPPKGSQINIQWHFYNSTELPQQDMSAVQVCTVPASQRANTASVSWIGTEDLNGNVWTGGVGMPPHQESTFEGTCNPLREGMSPDEPIHVIAFWPHMHQLGTLMETFVVHTDGSQELVFSKPFDFNQQIHYLQDFDLQPGEALRAVCHFNNTTDRGVPFGESSDTEMCYQFTFSYPAHALENHVPSLIGATNTCW